MSSWRSLIRVLVLSLPATLGCAPAYHWYDGCRVPCKYCAPCPRPYEYYHGCPCHSCAAQPYLTSTQPELVNPAEATNEAATDGAPGELR